MTRIAQVNWHVTPLSLPRPHRHCSTCGGPRPFRCSGKVRLNANGRRLDAWLIYKCTVCDRTWNLPLMDRVPVADLSPADLSALQTSDPAWVWPHALDLTALRSHALQVVLPEDLAVDKRPQTDWTDGCSRVLVSIHAAWPTGLRLDRLLAAELGLSRSSLMALPGRGALRIVEGPRDALRMPLAGSVVLQFDTDRIAESARPGLIRALVWPPAPWP